MKWKNNVVPVNGDLESEAGLAGVPTPEDRSPILPRVPGGPTVESSQQVFTQHQLSTHSDWALRERAGAASIKAVSLICRPRTLFQEVQQQFRRTQLQRVAANTSNPVAPSIHPYGCRMEAHMRAGRAWR